MELSGEMWSAIVGAIVGGAISFGLQTISTRAAQRERRESKRQADLAKANALIIKVIRIASDLVNYNNHVKEQRAEARRRGLLPDKWASLLPLANHPLPVAFSTEEMALLLELKVDELFNRVIILDQLHTSTIAIWVLYGDKRAALQDLPSQFECDGPIGTVRLEGAELQRWLPRIVEVESLAQQLIVRTERDAEEATAVMNDLGKVLQERGASSIKLQASPTAPST